MTSVRNRFINRVIITVYEPLARGISAGYKTGMTNVLENILHRLEKLGLAPSAASLEAGLSADAIRNVQRTYQRTGKVNVTLETLEKLAPVLETTVTALIEGDENVPQRQSSSEVTPIRPRLVPVPIVGRAAAGLFYEVDSLDQSALEVMHLPPDDKFPQARQMAFVVQGDSMNDLKPRPLLPGDKVICVAYEDVASILPVIQGMVVVVQRTRDGGHTIEWSVKQVELQPEKTIFHPRSTNLKHKPILISRDALSDDGTRVEILAVVRRVVTDLPLS